jgi:hypothetical protein
MPPSIGLCDLNDFPLDFFGQQPRINRLYTQITFCFSAAISTQLDLQGQAINALKQGVERLLVSFPWVAGKVIKEHGIYKTKAREEPLSFLVKDLGDDDFMPNWDTMSQVRFPLA